MLALSSDRIEILENLRQLHGAPGVQMQVCPFVIPKHPVGVYPTLVRLVGVYPTLVRLA